jgi:tetratricopeptide (TPR) repeat protein
VEGARASDLGDPDRAVPLLEEAVALDTGFAMAYRKLGVALENAGLGPQRADSAYARAYRYRNRLSERERDLTTAAYFDFGPGHDRARAAAAYEEVLARDSIDIIALNNMANLMMRRREFARAESLQLRSIRAGVASALEHENLMVSEFNRGELDSAAASAAEFKRRFPGSPSAERMDEPFLYQRGQLDSLVLLEKRLQHSRYPGNRVWATYRLAQLAMLHGRLAESARLQSAARAADAARGALLPPLEDSITSAYVDAWFRGQPARAIAKMDALLARVRLDTLPPLERHYDRIATVYAIAGRPDRARAVLARIATEVKDSALVRFMQPALHDAWAEIALAEHRPRDAIIEFARGDSLPDGPAYSCSGCLSLKLARAYDQAGDLDSARVMLERYQAAREAYRLPFTSDEYYYAGAYKRLGELYDARGDHAKAAVNYARFVALWKDADPELQPSVAAVRKRLAQLHDDSDR